MNDVFFYLKPFINGYILWQNATPLQNVELLQTPYIYDS